MLRRSGRLKYRPISAASWLVRRQRQGSSRGALIGNLYSLAAARVRIQRAHPIAVIMTRSVSAESRIDNSAQATECRVYVCVCVQARAYAHMRGK